jgi:hypothetical protein
MESQRELTIPEMEAISNLEHNIGFRLVMDRLVAEYDTLSDKIDAEADPNVVLGLVATWKALRITLRTVRSLIGAIRSTLEESRDITNYNPDFDPAVVDANHARAMLSQIAQTRFAESGDREGSKPPPPIIP